MEPHSVHSHTFQDLVWTVRADAEAGVLGIQVRNPAAKSAAFYLLDMRKGSVGPEVVLENGWWTELQAVRGNLLFIGRYGDPAMPVISEVVAVDGWRATVVEASMEQEPDAQWALQLPSYSQAEAEALHPEVLAGSSIAVLETGATVIRAWHGLGEKGIELWMEVWEGGQCLLRTCLEAEMEKLNPAPFFTTGQWLVFIRYRRELCWVELGG
jgi:hypothetical protein